MNIFVTLLCGLICLQGFCTAKAEADQTTKINWLTNYEEAINQSKATSKPIVLFFTGSDWCGWCNKLEEEALDTMEFAQAAGDKFIFVKLDFPLNTTLPSQQTAQNKQLQKKYDVKGFPTLIILNPQQQQIGTTGYRPGGGKQYANHLLKLVNEYSSYQSKLQNLEQQSGPDLKNLYEQANELSRVNDAALIIKKGLNSDERKFFLVERYRYLIEEGKIHDTEAIALKQELLASDPNNEEKLHYQIAVMDFEAACEEMAKDNSSPDKAVAPLVAYIDKFSSQDPVNIWRLEMLIAQVYFDKNDLSEALHYAQAAHETSPASIQPEIATLIRNIQSQMTSAN